MNAVSTFLIGAILSTPLLAAVPDTKLAQLLDASGLEAHIQSFADLTSAGVEQGFRQSGQIDAVSPDHISAMQAQARRDFAADSVRKAVLDTLNRALDDTTADAQLAWFDSDAGRAIAAAESHAATAAGVAEMQSYIQTLQDHVPSQTRITHIEQLDNAAHMAETAMQIQSGTVLVTLTSMNAVAPPALQRDLSDLSTLTEQLLDAAVRRDTVMQTGLQLLYTYRDIPDPALEAYLAHLRSPAGRTFADAQLKAISDAMSDASLQYGGAVADLIAAMPRGE